MAIRCTLKLLMAQKEIRDGRKITYRDIKEATGVAESTLSALANNKVKLFAASTLEALCLYFQCTLGDLLILEESSD